MAKLQDELHIRAIECHADHDYTTSTLLTQAANHIDFLEAVINEVQVEDDGFITVHPNMN